MPLCLIYRPHSTFCNHLVAPVESNIKPITIWIIYEKDEKMKHTIPKIRAASVYARSDAQRLVREIIRIEGIRSLNRMDMDI